MPRDAVGGSASTRTGNDKRGRTKRGLTCANCRTRKTRCDGSLPGCKTCEVYNVPCRYERTPPMSQVVAMAGRLQDAENTITELRAALEQATHQRETDTLGRTIQDDSHSSHISSPISATDFHGIRNTDTDTLTRVKTNSSLAVEEELLSDLSLDEHGKLCYYGPTSAVHAPPPESTGVAETRSAFGQSSITDARMILTTTAIESRSWEEYALGNAAMQTGIPHHTLSRLLQIHWAWIAPTFNWVYRPAFMRDMVIGGPSYSPLLLTVLCAHSARFDSRETSEMLVSRARLLLGAEIHHPSSISTAQALLQLSARDLAYGSISQAWLYSGMAFRMVSDLGLHHSTARIATLGCLGAEDLEIRRRLFWSCYLWDKAISLYLGRTPVMPDLPSNRSLELMDDSAENDMWSPHCGEWINLSNIPVGEYPPAKAHLASSFENCCKLAVILNDIISALYSRRGLTNADENLRRIQSKLEEWREKSPSHLRYDPDNLPQICPPPHIFSQNLLYYTAIILLHRPFYSVPSHHAACREAAENIEKLMLLFERTFGFTRITYLIAYCIYTGASVMVHDSNKGNVDAKMMTFLRALKDGITTCPVVQRSLDIINNGIKSGEKDVSQVEPDTFNTDDLAMTGNYLPAFPYQAPDLTFGAGPFQQVMEFDDSLLDCFPEAQLADLEASGTWFFPAT